MKTDLAGIGSDGKAFLHWDNVGHYLEYAFDVPRDGAYHLTLKYCSDSEGPVRALVVDGVFHAEWMKAIDFDWTGGWSNHQDDWRLKTITDPKTNKPCPLHLTAGRHMIRLVNVRDSMNLDVLVLHSPDVEVE